MKHQIEKLFTLASMVLCFTALINCPLRAADPAPVAAKSENIIAEEIKTESIRHEQGFCYIAGLAIERQSDIGGGESECVLLEDGKPLATPHSGHQDIRDNGKGKYSHWGNAIYFSASDNSDPRTNGKKYTLVSTKK